MRADVREWKIVLVAMDRDESNRLPFHGEAAQ